MDEWHRRHALARGCPEGTRVGAERSGDLRRGGPSDGGCHETGASRTFGGAPMTGRPWTDAEVAALVDLINQGLTFVAAARRLGRGPVGTRRKWLSLSMERIGSIEADRVGVAPECIEEGARRSAAPQRTLIGAWVGDPPVGYSALDRRVETRAPRVTVYELPEGAAPPLVPDDDPFQS